MSQSGSHVSPRTSPFVGYASGWMAQAVDTSNCVQRRCEPGIQRGDDLSRSIRPAQTLTPADTKRLCMVATIALDDRRLDGLIQQAGPALVAIRKAAGMCRCDWGMEIRSCDDLANGRLSVSSVNVIRIACLSARWHAELGARPQVLDDVFAGLTLAHRIGTGGLTFARLLECGSEVPAFQTLGRILTGLDSASLDDLSRRLAMLPPPEPAWPRSVLSRGSCWRHYAASL